MPGLGCLGLGCCKPMGACLGLGYVLAHGLLPWPSLRAQGGLPRPWLLHAHGVLPWPWLLHAHGGLPRPWLRAHGRVA